MTISRRTMLMLAGGALMPWTPGVNIALGADVGAPRNILVYIFLRFGMDGLHLLAPADDGAYRQMRPSIAINTVGLNAAPALAKLDGVQFFLHPDAGQLRQMFIDKELAFVHAVGAPTQLRSHFEVQEMVDKGIGDADIGVTNGWLARHLLTRVGPASEFLATADSVIGTSPLRGTSGIVPTTELESLPYYIDNERGDLMSALNKGNTPSAKSVQTTLKICQVVRERVSTLPRTPNPNYTFGNLSNKLQPLARAIKMNMGIEVATVDYGGWDHHEYINNNFSNSVEELSNALYAFTDDLGPTLMSRVTIAVQTEFGRRAYENATYGTDHGAASVMMVMGAGVAGGKIYGQWPGMKDNQLDGGDLAVTTDSRQVLSEILTTRMSQERITSVFPSVAYKPLGLISG